MSYGFCGNMNKAGKQGTNHVMPVRFKGLNLDDVSEIKFLFKQNETTWIVKYPSNNAERRADSDNIVDILWSEKDTWRFKENNDILMDTKVFLTDSWENPKTPIVKIRLSPTLFVKGGGA